jgi:hypothetical protein
LLLAGCTPTSSACPPLTGSVKATPSNAAAGEISSVSIANNTYAYFEDGSAWCSLSQFSVTKIDLTSLPACPGAGCLGALDVKPDNVRFDKKPGTTTTYPQTNWPSLTYDLSKNPHNDVTSYAIYQYTTASVPWCGGTSPWCYVGSAAKDTGVDSASGKVKHYSTFALVALLPPEPLPLPDWQLPAGLRMIVASEFISTNGDTTVAFEWIGSDIELRGDRLRLYRFVNPEIRSVEIGDPDACPEQNFADRMTCYFPPNTQVDLVIGDGGIANQVVISSASYLVRIVTKEFILQ